MRGIDKSETIFANPMPNSVVNKAQRQRRKYQKKFGSDEKVEYILTSKANQTLAPFWGVKNIIAEESGDPFNKQKGIVIGNIRMGFGHYRIAMAIASAARALKMVPYWFDLTSFPETTGAKVINHLEGLYSLGSRLSQKYSLFNKYYWEPLNSEGFRKLEFNAIDQSVSSLMAPICRALPKEVPFISTHVWPAQAAVHAGHPVVINMIPDNWPMALHLAEGAVHTVQSPSAYLGYRILRGMDPKRKTILKPIGANTVFNVGHYIDHELVIHIERDCQARIERAEKNKEKRLLMSIGGAGAQREIYIDIIKRHLNEIQNGRLAVFFNLGDHLEAWEGLKADFPQIEELSTQHFKVNKGKIENNWPDIVQFTKKIQKNEIGGIHTFLSSNIFEAVYATNLLMHGSDILITKPSELAFYPIPKLFIKRIGGHEMWGAVRSAEMGDGSFECSDPEIMHQTLDLLIHDNEAFMSMCYAIMRNNEMGLYNGAMNIIELAQTLSKEAGRPE